MKAEPIFKFKDKKYPKLTFDLFGGPFKDDEGEEYFTFVSSDGCDCEGYINDDGGVDIVVKEYYGD